MENALQKIDGDKKIYGNDFGDLDTFTDNITHVTYRQQVKPVLRPASQVRPNTAFVRGGYDSKNSIN
jgi:hypothetical protein